MPANHSSPASFNPSNWSDRALVEHVARAKFNPNSGNFDVHDHESELARRFGLSSAFAAVQAEVNAFQVEWDADADERAA
jgi:hypothetical protein